MVVSLLQEETKHLWEQQQQQRGQQKHKFHCLYQFHHRYRRID